MKTRRRRPSRRVVRRGQPVVERRRFVREGYQAAVGVEAALAQAAEAWAAAGKAARSALALAAGKAARSVAAPRSAAVGSAVVASQAIARGGESLTDRFQRTVNGGTRLRVPPFRFVQRTRNMQP